MQLTRRTIHAHLHSAAGNDTHPFYRMPEVYDILHAPGTAGEVRGLERIARLYSSGTRAESPRSTWLEPACGTARYLVLAHRRGHHVIGIDSSPEMVAYARRHLGISDDPPAAKSGAVAHRRPTASIHLGDITGFAHLVAALSVDFAFNLINSIRHLPDDASMLAHFEQMARVLKPGRVYAVGLGLSSYALEIPTEDIWIGKRARTEVRQCVQYLPPENGRATSARQERCISHLTVTRPGATEDIDFVYDLRSYDLKQLTRLVSRSALKITRAVDEDGHEIAATEPGYAIFLLSAK